MAWKKESTASRRARVAKQLRDKHGKWIEMGGGVKWFKNGSWHNGTASAFKGNNVEVTMEDGSKQLVNHREIEPIRAKASLKPSKPEGSVQAKKAPGKASKEVVIVKDNDPDKRLTSNASDLEEGDEVYAAGESYAKRFSMDNKEAERNEEAGFKVNLDSNGEPERARVIDTSGDKVTLEDSSGKRYEIPKTDNVLIDDEEMDAALQNADDNDEVPDDVDDFDVKSVNPKDLNIPEGAIAAYNKGVTASKGDDMDKAEKNFEAKNGKEFSDDFSLGWTDGPHIRDKARDKFQGLYHKYAQKNASSQKQVEEPKAELPEKNESDLPLDGLDLSDEDKKRINEAETGEEALKALKDSEAGEYLAIARQNKNKEFVDAYRKAVNDINDKHQVVEKKEAEAPKAEEKKSAGTPVEAIEKSVANLSEDLKEIDSNELDDDAEAAALTDAAYDIKNDNGDEFLLTGSRNEDGDWQVDVSDPNGNVIGSHNPKDAGSSQKLAEAIQNSINSNQSSKDSDAPTEEPEAPAEKPEEAEKEEAPSGAYSKKLVEIQDDLLKAITDGTSEDFALGDEAVVKVRPAGMPGSGEVAVSFWDSAEGDNASLLTSSVRATPDEAMTNKVLEKAKKLTKNLDAKSQDDLENPKDFFGVENVPEPVQAWFQTWGFDNSISNALRNDRDLDYVSQHDRANHGLSRLETAVGAFTDRAFHIGDAVEGLDKLIEDNKLTENKTLFRGIKLSADLESKLTPGSTFTDKSFSSFTSNEKQAASYSEGKNGAILELSAPAGSKALDLDPFLKDVNYQKEFLLGRNTQIRVDSVETDESGKKRIKASIVEGNENVGEDSGRAEAEGPNSGENDLDRGSDSDSGSDTKKLNSLKDVGFSDEDVEAIANAKDETEARKLFFQSESGKKVNQESLARQDREKNEKSTTEDLDDQDAYDEASKAFEDFVQKNFETGKSVADKKLAEDLKERAEIDAEHTPEGQDAKAKNTVEQMKDRKDGLSDEKKLAELDRKIVGAEKMLKTTKDEKLKKRIESDIARFKSEKEELSKPKAEEEEPATEETTSQGSDFTVPENGVSPLNAKLSQNDQKPIEFLKAGDKFMGTRNEKGEFVPLGATKTRATPDGHTWEVTDVKKEGLGGAQITVTAKNSSGEEVTFNAGVGDRKTKIVLDTPGTREKLGLGSPEKEAEKEEANADDSDRVSSNARSTIDEATADAKEELEDGKSWDDLKDRVWPVEDSDGEYVAVGARSTDEDKFLGLYDKDDEELDTFPFEGGNDDRGQSDEDRSEDGDGGTGDSDTGGRDVPESNDGANSSDDEASLSRGVNAEVSQEEYEEKSQTLLKDDKGESAEDGARVEFSDGYALEKEDQGDGRYKILVKDEDDKRMSFFWPQKIGDNFPERLKKLSDAHKKSRRLSDSDEDSEERRNLDIDNDDKRMASIGTQFTDDDGNTFTKINATSWARHLDDKDSDLAEVSQFNPEGKKWNFSHDINDRKEKNLEDRSEEELRQQIAEADKRIRDVVRREGELQDADRYGKRITPQMNDEHQRKAYEAYALNKGAEDATNELWKRIKDSDDSDKSPIDTGDFSPNNGSELPHTNDRGNLDSDAAFRLRNEYVGIDSKTVAMNSELRNSDKPSRAAAAWGTKMDKWANSGELADDYELYRSVLASPDRAAEYKPGALIEDKGIMSVGDNMGTAINYLAARTRRTAGKVPVLMTIEGRKGSPMIAADGGSEELVIPRGAKLFVSDVKDDEMGVRHVRAVLNPTEAEIAEWTGKKSDSSSEAPEAEPETPSTPDVEAPTSPEVEAPAAPEAKPGFKAVEGFEAGDRVFHPKHGAGEIVRRESNGQYARIKFDGSGKIMGISLTKVTPGESGPDPEAKASTPKTPSAHKEVSLKSGSTAETEGWSVGEPVTHGKHGAGKIARLEGNGEYARVQFDDLPEGTLKGIKLSQLGRNGESKTTPPVSERGEFKVDGRVSHKGNKGEGTIKKISEDGTFALIAFDNEPDKLRGIRFSRLNNGSSSFEDPDTKVDSKKKKSEESDIIDPSTKVEDPKTGKSDEDKGQPKLYVGAIIVHAQLGRGRVVKIGSGKNPSIQIIFDNDPTGKPRSLANARLKDIAIEPKKQS